ncbi:TPA: DUF551 domain-containing protein [Enterobacter kobei]|nr:DUF551 domain-containing protein [Enterobacter kobei]
MSTITRELAKLFRKITNSEIDAEGNAHVVLSPADSLLINNARIALASLEAEPVAWLLSGGGAKNNVSFDSGNAYTDPLREVTPLYTAPPAPVSVPDEMEMDDDFDSAFEHGKAVGWNAFRAAMLQGAGPVTIKANGGGSEKDEPPKRGWVVTHSGKDYFYREQGDAATHMNAAVESGIGVSLRSFIPEPVTTAYKLPEDFDFNRFNDVVWLEAVASNPHMHSPTTSTIAMVALELNRRLEAGNSPVIPDGWVACSERMPEKYDYEIWTYSPTKGVNHSLGYDGHASDFSDSEYYSTIDDVTHWMPITRPAAPHFREISNSSTKHFRENAETSTKCWCRTCRPVTISDMRFVVCPECGNKRCPHANDHRNACTGSNEPGQEGSAYPAAPQQEVK